MPQCCTNIAEKISAFLDNWEANEKRNLFASVLSGLFVSIYILKIVKKYSSTFFIVGFCHLLLACYTSTFLVKICDPARPVWIRCISHCQDYSFGVNALPIIGTKHHLHQTVF